jgi:hypothetical protein
MLCCLKHQWHVNTKNAHQLEMIDRLQDLIHEIEGNEALGSMRNNLRLPRFNMITHLIQQNVTSKTARPNVRSAAPWQPYANASSPLLQQATRPPQALGKVVSLENLLPDVKPPLIAKSYFCMAQWQGIKAGRNISEQQLNSVNAYYESAQQVSQGGWAKMWHKYGIFNMIALRMWLENQTKTEAQCLNVIINSMRAFAKSVALCHSGNRHETLQVRLPLLAMSPMC